MSKKYDDKIDVEVIDGQPRAFVWRGRHYLVDQLLKKWREVRSSWDPGVKQDFECFRVEASGGTYDLYFDRLSTTIRQSNGWRLKKVWD